MVHRYVQLESTGVLRRDCIPLRRASRECHKESRKPEGLR